MWACLMRTHKANFAEFTWTSPSLAKITMVYDSLSVSLFLCRTWVIINAQTWIMDSWMIMVTMVSPISAQKIRGEFPSSTNQPWRRPPRPLTLAKEKKPAAYGNIMRRRGAGDGWKWWKGIAGIGGNLKSTLGMPKSSKIIQNHPKSSKIIQNHPKSSKIIQNHPKSSLPELRDWYIWHYLANYIRWPLQIFTYIHHYSPTTSYNLIHSCHSSNANDVSRMTSRVNQLHDELALESVTNIEFEQSSWPWLVILGPGKVKKKSTGYLWHLGTGNKRIVYLCGSDYSIL